VRSALTPRFSRSSIGCRQPIARWCRVASTGVQIKASRTTQTSGVDIVGIASLVTFLENTSAYRRAYRECEYGRLKDDREFLRAVSPLTHIDDIAAPPGQASQRLADAG